MKLDPKTTAVLTLDFQKGILGMVANASSCLGAAAKVADFARERGCTLIHVGLGFAEGHPEIPEGHSTFQQVKTNKLFVKGTPSAEFDPQVARPGELIVHKQRVSAFSENQLHMILRARRIETLVLFGVATSGIVLSTVRQGFDLDYRQIVVKDACFDGDEETHRVLVDKIFLRQATVLTADELLAAQA